MGRIGTQNRQPALYARILAERRGFGSEFIAILVEAVRVPKEGLSFAVL